jgi:alkylated DNA repair dioxygenase AlkB
MSQQSLFTEDTTQFDLPDAELHYRPQFFPKPTADRLLQELMEKIEWTQNKIRFYGKESLVPRLEAWYGDPGKSYAYSGIQMNPKPWTKELVEIKEAIEKEASVPFNSVLINYYRDGKDRVAWHSDDEKELGQNPIIGSVSLGAERKFKLRHKKYKENGLKAEIMLQHGSFLLMKGPTQHHWMHEIPRTAKPIGPRINLTFRIIC